MSYCEACAIIGVEIDSSFEEIRQKYFEEIGKYDNVSVFSDPNAANLIRAYYLLKKQNNNGNVKNRTR